MQPGHGRDMRRDDCSQRHRPHRIHTRPWDGPDTTGQPASPPAPFSRTPRSSGSPAGHLKDAPGAATAAGLRPVPDLTSHSPRILQRPGNRRRQSRTPFSRRNPAKPPLTRPRSFRDDRPRCSLDLPPTPLGGHAARDLMRHMRHYVGNLRSPAPFGPHNA